MPLNEPDQKTLTIKDSQVQDQIQVSISFMTLINPSGVSAWDSVTSVPMRRFMFSFGSFASRFCDRNGFLQVECRLGCSYTHSCTRALEVCVCVVFTAYDIMLYESMIFRERGETLFLIVYITFTVHNDSAEQQAQLTYRA